MTSSLPLEKNQVRNGGKAISAACSYIMPVSASVFTCSLPVCVSSSLLIRTPVIWNLGPILIQYDIIIASYICGYPASKSGHFLKFWVDMSWGWGRGGQ